MSIFRKQHHHPNSCVYLYSNTFIKPFPSKFSVCAFRYVPLVFLDSYLCNQCDKCFSVRNTVHQGMIINFIKTGVTSSHYPERASALDFKDATTPRFGHSDVVFNLVIETNFFAFNRPFIQSFKIFIISGITGPKLFDFTCKKYHQFGLLSIFADD